MLKHSVIDKKLFITRALMHRPDSSDAYGGPVLRPCLKVFVSNRKMRFDRENDYYPWKKITRIAFFNMHTFSYKGVDS